ncbi:hypothetical protein CWE12_05815 [Aliidiomarina sedimenti]|uniref:Uncharacterized protein n=1 Tax=Aliidiomarina sedimenti TaxID=1933879 RepID=A0ABY0C0B6_9GAMM|nr:hypothetical protein CWE12_05815 [Aliidiomarina sedimenti]
MKMRDRSTKEIANRSIWNFIFIKGIAIWGGVFFLIMFGAGFIRGEYSEQGDFIFGLIVWSGVAILGGALFGYLEWVEKKKKKGS